MRESEREREEKYKTHCVRDSVVPGRGSQAALQTEITEKKIQNITAIPKQQEKITAIL